MNKTISLLIILVIVLGGAALFFGAEDTEAPSDVPAVDMTSPMDETPSGEGDDNQPDAVEMTPSQAERIELADVSGGSGTGYATRQYVEGEFNHQVFAELPEPEGGSVYEGWLVRGAPGDENFHFISTGVMEDAGEGTWEISFTVEQDYRDYTGVVITLETIVDETPEDHILDGSFTS